jgi:UDP-N-acetylmuramyl pentapeptide synthase
MIKKIIQLKLRIIAQLLIWRFKPQIIAITGNMGKTTTKLAIAHVLKNHKDIRYSEGNLNNEFGVPLTIIGGWDREYYERGSSAMFWFKVVWSGFFRLFSTRYPEILILEYGADHPGDIKKLAKIYKPHISVVSGIGEIPVHVQYFSTPKNLAEEKRNIISHLSSSDYAILNHDDPLVLDMQSHTKAHVKTYGFTGGSDTWLSDFNIELNGNIPTGISFSVSCDGKQDRLHIPETLSKGVAFAAGAALTIAHIHKISLSDAVGYLATFAAPKGRLKLLKGIKNSYIIDDSYNASPASTTLAIETLKSLPAQRKIAVLGDMRELGEYSISAHQKIGNLIGGHVGVLVCVGAAAKFIGESASDQMSSENIHYFETSELAKKKVQELIKEGDLVLVKGSEGVRTERIVEEIMAEPENKKNLIVRQSERWLSTK